MTYTYRYKLPSVRSVDCDRADLDHVISQLGSEGYLVTVTLAPGASLLCTVVFAVEWERV